MLDQSYMCFIENDNVGCKSLLWKPCDSLSSGCTLKAFCITEHPPKNKTNDYDQEAGSYTSQPLRAQWHEATSTWKNGRLKVSREGKLGSVKSRPVTVVMVSRGPSLTLQLKRWRNWSLERIMQDRSGEPSSECPVQQGVLFYQVQLLSPGIPVSLVKAVF